MAETDLGDVWGPCHGRDVFGGCLGSLPWQGCVWMMFGGPCHGRDVLGDIWGPCQPSHALLSVAVLFYPWLGMNPAQSCLPPVLPPALQQLSVEASPHGFCILGVQAVLPRLLFRASVK